MPPLDDADATGLLQAVRDGDGVARDRLFALLYDELRGCAHRQLRDVGQLTLSTTVLVNETYLKLAAASQLGPDSRRHFIAIAAQAMRQVLIDNARRIGASKRGGEGLKVTLNEAIPADPRDSVDILALDKALLQLERIDERAARVVHLHFFGGLSFAEIARLENLNERTIKRDWKAARLLLAEQMRSAADASED